MNSQATTKTARTQSRNAGSLTGSHGSSRSARKNRVLCTGRPRESYSMIGTRTAAAGLSPASASWSPYRAERSSELRCGRASGTPPVYPPTGEFQLRDAGAVRREARCRGSRHDRSGRLRRRLAVHRRLPQTDVAKPGTLAGELNGPSRGSASRVRPQPGCPEPDREEAEVDHAEEHPDLHHQPAVPRGLAVSVGQAACPAREAVTERLG